MANIYFELNPAQPETILIKSNGDITKIESFLTAGLNVYPPYADTEAELANFISCKNDLLGLLDYYKITYELGPKLKLFLEDSPSYFSEIEKESIDEEVIEKKLKMQGFIRKPTTEQMRNLVELCKLRCGANFSVPGSGKTTEALAFYAFNRKNTDSKLLVISPINAFLSWKTELKKCMDTEKDFQELHGDFKTYKAKLNDSDNQFFMTTYSQLRIEDKYEQIQKFLLRNPDTFVIVDESHNMKARLASEYFRRMAPLCRYKLILTGTPMPQGAEDLETQFDFLYPLERMTHSDDYMEKFQPIYVRTTKKELGLMPVLTPPPIKVPPYPAFEEFYQKHIKAPYEKGQDLEQILQVSSFKKAVLKLLNLMSNPLSYLELIQIIDYGLAERIKSEGYGSKFDVLMKRTADLISQGEKVLVWSYFSYSVECISNELRDKGINNVTIKGNIRGESVDVNNEDDDYDLYLNREDRIKKFLEDPECKVMVANPASAAESMSLHEVCNHAIYLDRTYNAGQFLQSQDRIHRLIEKEKEQQKTIEIIQLDTPGSLDFSVDERLKQKIEYMGEFLDDPYLKNIEGYSHQDEDNELKGLREDGQLLSKTQ